MNHPGPGWPSLPAMSLDVVILAGGVLPGPEVRAALPAGASCIAADSGLDHALALGLHPDLLVGDLDSISPPGLAWAEAAARRGELTIERHPAAKDQTDLELALVRAVEMAPDRIVVAGIGGGRFDHLLANIGVLADSRFAGAAVDGLLEGARVAVIHDRRTLSGQVDELVSLLPVNGDAVGVTTDGLVWPLSGETLRAGSSRGVSNVFAASQATVSVVQGTLLAVQTGQVSAAK